MLEDFSMEKKPSNRSGQALGKGCGTELKKTQETTSNAVSKQFPRSSRRREPPGPKLDQNRRSSGPQKSSRASDRRPRPREQYFGAGKADSQVVEELAEEFGLVVIPGSKKQSLNHLLNFHYAPRTTDNVVRSGRGVALRRNNYNQGSSWLSSTNHKHKYNKEQFLQANCQFVVRSDGDYGAYLADPDLLVDWDFIEQIRVLSSEEVNCPICLSPPVAGKITRCGHVFCWPCMLHYLALSDKSWRKCPICYESVHRQDLKSVLVLLRSAHTIGESITFQLMKRERGTLIASPVTQFVARQMKSSILSVGEAHLDTVYSKLLTADINQVFEIIKKEKSELDVQVTENQGCPELCFIEEAVQLLTERHNQLQLKQKSSPAVNIPSKQPHQLLTSSSFSPDEQDMRPGANFKKYNQTAVYGSSLEDGGVAVALSCSKEIAESPPQTAEKDINDSCDEAPSGIDTVGRCRYISNSSEGEEMTTMITAEDLQISTQHTPNTPSKHFFFYQAIDGQQVFMHAVNIRMLEMTYGTLEQCPAVITAAIVEKEAGSMTEDLRKRLRYLQHLPLTCQFEVAEVQLAPPVITKETVDCFKDQLESRKKRREKRAREERRIERRVVERVHKQYGMARASPRLRIESLHQFPECGSGSDTQTAPEPPYRPPSTTSSRASSPLSLRSASPTANCGPSFAQMLRDGKSANVAGGSAWPSITTPSRRQQQQAPEFDSDTECGSVPQYRQSFSAALATAFDTAEGLQDKENDAVCAAVSGKKKKKRNKKVLLFSTGMVCTSK